MLINKLNIKLLNIFFYSYFFLALYRINILIAAIPFIVFIAILIINFRSLIRKIILGRYYDYPIFLYIIFIPIGYGLLSLLANQYGIFEYGRVLATTLPIVVIFLIQPAELKNINIIKPFLIFGFLAASTIYFQYVYGPVDWFAADSMRGGFNRYASLAGNLNSYPIGLGGLLALYIIYNKSNGINFINILGFLFLTIAGILTLSKIAVLNIIIVCLLTYLIYFKILNLYKYFYKIIIAIFLLFIIYYLIKENDYIVNYFELILSFVGLGSPKVVDYHLPLDDVVYRLTDLPDFNSWSLFEVIFGGGLIAFGSSVGANGTFYHNDYINYISAGGVLGLFVLLNAIIRPIKISRDIATLSFILLVNLCFGSGVLFHFFEGYILIAIAYFARCKFEEIIYNNRAGFI